MVQKAAFTLIELIVVITILAILATVGFLSYQWYSSQSRDSVRLTDMKKIESGLHLSLAKTSQLPLPDNFVNITVSGAVKNYQWLASSWVLSNIWVHGWSIDPVTQEFYIYSVGAKKQKYQILSFFEQDKYTYLNNNVFTENQNKYPKLRWEKLWIILNKKDFSALTNDIDILDPLGENYIYLNGNKKIVLTDENKNLLAYPHRSCKSILESWIWDADWIYTIKYKDHSLNVYCDMTSVWWWWTLFYANNWNPESPIKKSYTQMRDEVIWQDNFLYDLSDYNYENLVWVLDYSIFSNNWSHEILTSNRDYLKSEWKWLYAKFDSWESLNWVLWNDILWSQYEELWHCIEIPNWWTISLTDSQWDSALDNHYILNHWWQVIGISSESYNCNWYTQDKFKFAMFYTAQSNWDEFRTRFWNSIWWEWRSDNQYRYFIR